MNRMLVCLLTLVLLLVALPLAAQEDVYVIQPGDNLWNLAGAHLDDAKLWEQIYKDNPFLQEPGRRFRDEDGIVYVMIRPGEKLVGLTKLGIIATMTSIDRLHLPQEVKVYQVPTTPVWVWWPLGLALLVLIGVYLIYRMLTRDPVNSRPAMVPGGVTDGTASTAIQQVAARTAGNDVTASQMPGFYQRFDVLRQTGGRIWGVMTVRYADGRSVPRRLNGERAYEAEVRFPDGHTETLYMLQGCGNDLRYGGISRYLPGPEFRFEADPEVQSTPTPAPAGDQYQQYRTGEGLVPEVVTVPASVAPDVPATQAAPASSPLINQYGELVRTKDAPPQPTGVITFEFKRSNNGQPNMVRLQGIEAEEFTFSVGPDGTTLRYREVMEEKPAVVSK